MNFEDSTGNLSGLTKRLEQLCLQNHNKTRNQRRQKKDDNITHKITTDIPILDGVCNIQPKLNVEVHEKPIIHISKDLSTKLTTKFQSSTDALDDHI